MPTIYQTSSNTCVQCEVCVVFTIHCIEGFVARMGEERLPQRVTFVELVGGKGYSGGQENDRLAHLKEYMSSLE